MKPTIFIVLMLSVVGCTPQLNPENEETLKAMAWSEQTELPSSPTNKYADNEQAAQLGRQIFFDKRMSNDQTVACASCHVEQEGWSDKRPVSLGVAEAKGGRHSMPSHGIGFQQYFFWDGRADSAWSQTLQAIESSAEMDFARTQVAIYVSKYHKTQYEQIFGPMPDLQGIPLRAKPTDEAWLALPDKRKDDVNRVFANVGKSLEAYERRINCSNTRFDQWARQEVVMTQEEEQGAATFAQNGCTNCHSGVAFSDGEFHQLNVPSLSAEDNGREDGLTQLLDNPFNGAGVYSDDTEYGTAKLRQAMNETRTINAYKTPSLRGVTQRIRVGHSGQHSVEDFMDTFYRNNGGRQGNQDRDPLLNGVNVGGNLNQLVAFLSMLDCPKVDAKWGPPAED